MDSVGSYMDNVFVERLWRSVKYEEVYLKAYEEVYLKAYESVAEARGRNWSLPEILQQRAPSPDPRLQNSGPGVRGRKEPGTPVWGEPHPGTGARLTRDWCARL